MLRRKFRARRRALTPAEQRRARERIAAVMATLPAFRRARHVAVYRPADGEIDPTGIAERALGRRKAVLLPVITPVRGMDNRLRFAPWRPECLLARNRFGIEEPWPRRRTFAPWVPDLVLLPVVAFDDAGNRLGMGGGFYDRTFDPARPALRRPMLIGLAHAVQRAERLPTDAHDVPLDGIATDAGYLPTSPRGRL